MAKDKTIYTCRECGGTTPKWLGKCPHCNAWNTLEESVAESASGSKNRYQSLAQATPVTTSSAPPPAWRNSTACWAAASSKAAWC
jgi:DNA repair protein RadA/Sms